MFNFILIDDNRIDLLIASKAISMSRIETESVKDFTDASKALDHISTSEPGIHTIVLVDIRMPLMDGFGFMDAFNRLDEEKRSRYTCMFLTSSLNDLDRLRASSYADIRAFINKPLTSDKLLDALKNINLL